MRRLVFACLALTLAGCETEGPMGPPPPAPPVMRPAPPPPPPPVSGFRPGEFAWSTARGANAVVGLVAYRPNPRERWSCAGQSVSLIPEARYSRERMARVYGSVEEAIIPVGLARRRSEQAGRAEYEQFVRRTVCNAQGRFAFRDLPDGSYFLLALANPPKGRAGVESLAILQRVVLQGGFAKTVTMPRPPAARP